jgi:hypothetical protein
MIKKRRKYRAELCIACIRKLSIIKIFLLSTQYGGKQKDYTG